MRNFFIFHLQNSYNANTKHFRSLYLTHEFALLKVLKAFQKASNIGEYSVTKLAARDSMSVVPCLWELPVESVVSIESSKGFASTFHFSILLWPATTECRPIPRDAQVCLLQVMKQDLSFSKQYEKHVEMSVWYFQNNPTKLRYRDVYHSPSTCS